MLASGVVLGEPAPAVAARVGATVITEADLEARLAAEMQRLRTERYELLRQALEAAVTERLLDLAAREAGLSPEELYQRAVLASVPEPTDADVAAALELAGRPASGDPSARQEARAQLRRNGEQAAYEAYLAQLQEQYPVQRLLEPPRTRVAADGFPARGPGDATVTIVEFSDFQCPFCLRMVAPLKRLLERYPGEVRLVYRHFPLDSIHPEARKAAEASLCAHDQGRFWDFHDAIFRNPRNLSVVRLKAMADELGLDSPEFVTCLDRGHKAGAVAADLAAGEAAGVAGTPAFFINGRFVGGAVSYENLAAMVREELDRLQLAPRR